MKGHYQGIPGVVDEDLFFSIWQSMPSLPGAVRPSARSGRVSQATPFGVAPQLIIRDNDSKFGADFQRAAKDAGMRVLRTAVRAPLMNSVRERFLGSVRRECLDHVIILSERHLERVVRECCFRYFNLARPHQGIRQRVPVERVLKPRADPASVVSVPVLGGLHHDYRAAA
ncbi:MAG TPA: integrase core domain-containing protein [Polyangiaceae bacterium]